MNAPALSGQHYAGSSAKGDQRSAGPNINVLWVYSFSGLVSVAYPLYVFRASRVASGPISSPCNGVPPHVVGRCGDFHARL